MGSIHACDICFLFFQRGKAFGRKPDATGSCEYIECLMDLMFFFLQGLGKESTLNLRVPVWTNSDSAAKVSLNGQSLKLPASGIFVSIMVSRMCK